MPVEQLVLSLMLMWDLCMSCALSLMSRCYYIAVATRVTPVWIPALCEAEESFKHHQQLVLEPWWVMTEAACRSSRIFWALCMLQKAEQSQVRIERIEERLAWGTKQETSSRDKREWMAERGVNGFLKRKASFGEGNNHKQKRQIMSQYLNVGDLPLS